MDLSKIAKLRQRGGLEMGPGGQECVRLSVQQRVFTEGMSRTALKQQLEIWVERLRGHITQYGGDVVPGSLSTAGQTVEALVPVRTIEQASADLEELGARVDLVETRQIV